MTGLPSCDREGLLEVELVAILDGKMVKKKNVVVVVYGLVQWENGAQDHGSSWRSCMGNSLLLFPIIENKNVFK